MPPKKAPKKPRGQNPPFKVLIFSRTTGYRHTSIPAGIKAIQNLASNISSTTRSPFTADATEDPAIFDKPRTLFAYRVMILLQTSGDFLSPSQLTNFQNFVEKKGGGVVAIHCASCGHPDSEWYSTMIGGVFSNHPVPQNGTITVVDPKHAITIYATMANEEPALFPEKDLAQNKPPGPELTPREKRMLKRKRTISEDGDNPPNPYKPQTDPEITYTCHDEWYNFRLHPRQQAPNIHVLLTVDESTYTGGTHGPDHPIAWCQEFALTPKTKPKKDDRAFSNSRGSSSAHGRKPVEKPVPLSERGGRSFYTALGHFDEAYEDPRFMSQLMGAILWTAKVF